MAYLSQWLTFRTIRIFNIQPRSQMTKGHLSVLKIAFKKSLKLRGTNRKLPLAKLLSLAI